MTKQLTEDEKDQLWNRWMERLSDPTIPLCVGSWRRPTSPGDPPEWQSVDHVGCAMGQLSQAAVDLELGTWTAHDRVEGAYADYLRTTFGLREPLAASEFAAYAALDLGLSYKDSDAIMATNDMTPDHDERHQRTYAMAHRYYHRIHQESSDE